MSLARKKFTEFKERGGASSDTELDDFWATLAPATIDGMLGEWKGGEFRTAT
jgi:GXWXG protein